MVQQRFPGQELEAVRVGRALRLDEEAATAPDRSSGALERATGEAKPLQQHAPESRPVAVFFVPECCKNSLMLRPMGAHQRRH